MNDIAILSIISASFTFVIILIKLCFKSKCDRVDCCCFKIHRNTKQEVEERKNDIEHNIKSSDDIEHLKNIIK